MRCIAKVGVQIQIQTWFDIHFKMQKVKDEPFGIRDPLLPGSQGELSAMQRQNLSPRMQSKKKGLGTLKGDPELEKGKKSRNGEEKGKSSDKNLANMSSHESDSFFKMYNREIKVNQDEIPIILSELTDAAYNFIQREQYEKALILLQKTEGVLEVVTLDQCSRDKYISFITYNNMSMCFQKLNMLEECLSYLKESIKIVKSDDFLKGGSIAMRMKRVRHECKLKLQLCAILSQTQSHTEALNNAFSSVRLCHQLFKDLQELCEIFIDKINFRENLLAAQEQSDLEDEERQQIVNMVLDSSPAKELPQNFLEQSVSLAERSSLKLLPVIKEVRRRLAGEDYVQDFGKEKKDKAKKDRSVSPGDMKIQEQKELDTDGKKSSEDLLKKSTSADPEDDADEEEPADMRSVLGFLNQSEWISNLNIGNIMQIQPFCMKDFLGVNRDEHELARDSFLEKLSILTVSYFCMSTEMRFLLQLRGSYMKEEIKKGKELESEYWHAKALETSCTFLPSECPLLNHILLSYQKHHDPAKQPIREDEETTDTLSVLRPMKGIEQSKYQPIVRQVPFTVKVSLSPTSVGINHGLKTLLMQEEKGLVNRILKNHLKSQSKDRSTTEPGMSLRDESKESKGLPVKKHPAEEMTFQQRAGFDSQDKNQEVQRLLGNYSPSQDDPLNEESIQGSMPSPSPFEKVSKLNLDKDKDKLVGISDDQDLPVSISDLEKEKSVSPVSKNLDQKHLNSESRDQASLQPIQNISAISKNSNLYHLRSDSIKGLEKQLMDVVQSPQPGDELANINNKQEWLGLINDEGGLQDVSKQSPKENASNFLSHQEESIPAVDSIMFDNENPDNQVYDHIISKLLDNPKIDKKALLDRFIQKIELDADSYLQSSKDEISKLRNRTDALQRQIVSAQVLPPNGDKGNASMLIPQSSTEELHYDISQSGTSSKLPPKTTETRKRKKKLDSASVKQQTRFSQHDLGVGDSSIGEDNSLHRSMKESDGQKSGKILPPTRIKKRTAKPSPSLGHNASKTSNLSKTTGGNSKQIQKEARLANSSQNRANIYARQKPRPQTSIGIQKQRGSKTRKMLSYIESDDPLLKGLRDKSFDDESDLKRDYRSKNDRTDSESPILDVSEIQLEEKSMRSRQQDMNNKITGGINPSQESLDKQGESEDLRKQQLSSQKKSAGKTRPSSSFTNLTKSSSNMNRRRRQGANSLVPGNSNHVSKERRLQRTSKEIGTGSRSSSSQRKSGISNAGKRGLRRSGGNVNAQSTAAVPVQQFLQEQLLEQQNKENNKGVLGGHTHHMVSQQTLPSKTLKPSTKSLKQHSIYAPSEHTNSEYPIQHGHNQSQQNLAVPKKKERNNNASQKEIRTLLTQKRDSITGGRSASGYKTAQQPKQKRHRASTKDFNSVGTTVMRPENLNSTKTRAHQPQSSQMKQNVLLAQISNHMVKQNNRRGRSRKKKRIQGHEQGTGKGSIGSRSQGIPGVRSYSRSTGKNTYSGSSKNSRTPSRGFGGSSTDKRSKKSSVSKESRGNSYPRSSSNKRNQSALSEKHKISSKRRGNGKLEFKKQPGIFNVVTSQSNQDQLLNLNLKEINSKSNLQQQSIGDLKRQVLENQKILLQEMSKQYKRQGRSNSSEKKGKVHRNSNIPSQQFSQPRQFNVNDTRLQESLDILLKRSSKRAKSGGVPNKSGVKHSKDHSKGQSVDDPRVLMSKSLQFLQNLAKQQQLISQQNIIKNAAETLKHNAAQQNKSAHQRHKQVDDELIGHVNDIKAMNRQQSNVSASIGKKNSQRSQSPPQNGMARIPKKKNFNKVLSHAQIASEMDLEAEPVAKVGKQYSVGSSQYMSENPSRALKRQHANTTHIGNAHTQSAALFNHNGSEFSDQLTAVPHQLSQFSQEDFLKAQSVQHQLSSQQHQLMNQLQSAQNLQMYKNQQVLGGRQRHNYSTTSGTQTQVVRQMKESSSVSDHLNANRTAQLGGNNKREQRAGKQTSQGRVLPKRNSGASYTSQQQLPSAQGNFDEVGGSPLRMYDQQYQQLQLQQQQAHQQQKLYMR